MQITYFDAALAGLLHDVGKLLQRAQPNPTAPPTDALDGQPVHAAWSQRFIDTIPKQYRAAAMHGAFHHRPLNNPAQEKRMSILTALGDKLSAGERADPPEKQPDPPQQIQSIFDRIHLGALGEPTGTHFLPLSSVSLTESSLFPMSAPMQKKQSQVAYEKLVEDLQRAAVRDLQDPETYLENLLFALQATCWCVPSAYYHSIPDISLYDHCRMTASIAACLADWDGDPQALLEAVERDFYNKPVPSDHDLLQKPILLMVGGDLSGLQDFLYTISSKHAAKSLRGRSFYLQLLVEAILRYTLLKIGLPYVNVIYSGGGHFFFLAPISQQAALKDIRLEITRILQAAHGTALYLAMDWIEISAADFKLGRFPERWSALHDALADRKQQRFQELGAGFHDAVFEPSQHGGNPNQRCSVCGSDDHPLEKDRVEPDAQRCTLCGSFDVQLGAQLVNARQIAFGFGPPQEASNDTLLDILSQFGMTFITLPTQKWMPPRWVERWCVWDLDDDAPALPPELNGIAARARHYAVHHVPEMSFDKLQEEVKGGFQRLGVLRADVDHLGKIFREGIVIDGKPAGTLARTSMLSYQISLFFEGWVKKICDDPRWKGLIYSVYAGGDDLFLIAPWDIMPDLAMQIRDDFSRFTGDHPGLHISAGMAFIDGKYPVYQASADAGDAELLAKNVGRNRFTFLGIPWTWDAFKDLITKKDRLISLVKDDSNDRGGPKAVLGIIQQLYEQSQQKHNNNRREWGPWTWRGMYMLARMRQRYEKATPALAAEIGKLADEITRANTTVMEQWGKAARWAQLVTRKKSEKSETR